MHVNVGVSRLVCAEDSVVRRLVALEGDHELLVVEAERVARVEVDARVLAPDADVLLHDPPALLRIEPVPLARLHERIDEEVLRVRGANFEARLVGVLGRLGHRQIGVRRRAPGHQPALGQDDVELVDPLQVRRLREEQQVGVPARADQGECAQQTLRREVLARRHHLALVPRPLIGIEAPPGGIDLEKRVFHELPLRHAADHPR
jgi:hypothetical protein